MHHRKLVQWPPDKKFDLAGQYPRIDEDHHLIHQERLSRLLLILLQVELLYHLVKKLIMGR